MNSAYETDITVSDRLIVRRKAEHLRLVAEEDVEYSKSTLFEDVQLVHQALPEINLDDIDISTSFFGKKLSTPLMITGMTGGAKYAKRLNRILAEVAGKRGIALGLGSQRILLSHPELVNDFAVRDAMEDGVLLGNIGAVQLKEYPLDTIAELVKSIEADGICVHLNAAQELVGGEEGQQNYGNLLDKIAALLEILDGKLLVKETGAGLSPETLAKLVSIGVPFIDVSGSGGTSWTRVEALRAASQMQEKLGDTLSEWGIPTAFCTIAAGKIAEDKACIVASGGIRSGLDAARALVVGADIVGFARPVLLAYLSDGYDAVWNWFEQVEQELKATMFLTGARTVNELSRVPRVYTGTLRDWLASYSWQDGVTG